MRFRGYAPRLILGVTVLLVRAPSINAGPLGPGDFGPDATVLSFDSFSHGTFILNEFECTDGVILSSTAPIGGSFSSDPADSLQPGEATSPFVAVIVAVPSSSTSSPPNKVIATKYGAGGETLQCERCGISIRFLDPLPTQVGLYITDADQDQTVAFSGPSGLLATLTIGPSVGGPEFAGWEDPDGIASLVLRSRVSVGIGFDDLTFATRLAPFCPATPDADGDGVPDPDDVCPGTSPSAEVDSDGCSLDQFCTAIDTSTRSGERVCKASDWMNDEPLTQPRDCRVDKQTGLCVTR